MYMKITGALIGAAAGAVLLALGSLSAQALPAAAVQAETGVTLVADGCGPNRWRDRGGNCHWDRDRDRIELVVPRIDVLPRIEIEEPRRGCPFGTHWSFRRHECVLN
jgi:hypothetical protein